MIVYHIIVRRLSGVIKDFVAYVFGIPEYTRSGVMAVAYKDFEKMFYNL